MDALKRWLAVALLVASLGAADAAARPAMTKSHARHIARAASLTLSDVPGYDPQSDGATPGEDLWGGKRYARCSGRKGLGKALADVTRTFGRESSDGPLDLVGSEVEVMPKVAYAKQDLRLAGSAKGRACLVKEIRADSEGDPDLELVDISITKLSPGVPHGIGLHVDLTVRPKGGDEIDFVVDLLVIRDRNVEAAVVGTTIGRSHSRADLDRLLGIVRTRLRAQLHPDEVIV